MIGIKVANRQNEFTWLKITFYLYVCISSRKKVSIVTTRCPRGTERILRSLSSDSHEKTLTASQPTLPLGRWSLTRNGIDPTNKKSGSGNFFYNPSSNKQLLVDGPGYTACTAGKGGTAEFGSVGNTLPTYLPEVKLENLLIKAYHKCIF